MADKRKKRKPKKGNHGRGRTNRNHKDTLFRYIFKGKRELLTLYNALSGKEYSDPAALEITTLENVIYLHMKNDISFLIDHDLNLYEHQSSFNPNMPLRGAVLHHDAVRTSCGGGTAVFHEADPPADTALCGVL